MNRKKLIATSLVLTMAGSVSLVLAQTPPTTPPPTSMRAMHGHGMPAAGAAVSPGHRAGGMQHHAMGGMGGMDGMDGKHGGVIGDLRGLEKLYLISGRSKELPALYKDVLDKSQNPHVRDYVYRHLARAQMQPANVDASIATMRKALDESIANEAKMRASMEKMHMTWMQNPDSGPMSEANQDDVD